MAVASFVQVVPAGNGNTNAISAGSVAANAQTAVISTGPDMIVRICVTGTANVRFGTATNLSGASVSTGDIFLTAGEYIFDMGHYNNALIIFTATSGGIQYSVSQVSKN